MNHPGSSRSAAETSDEPVRTAGAYGQVRLAALEMIGPRANRTLGKQSKWKKPRL